MDKIKKFGPPAVLAVAGVKASELVGATNTWVRLGAAIAGAFVGLLIAEKI